ncbi:hypothetical protein [Nitrosomonas communis]|uniref:hypothetical protein n=1 Tax=Nitrosomonas communis TaxID=44574 RepID=UPI0026F15708|nr:hypothetical protein [Nitrosomonas communis]
MGLPDISPVPKKDPMGMDYIPVYESEEPPTERAAVKISTEKVMHREMVHTIRAVATMSALQNSPGC